MVSYLLVLRRTVPWSVEHFGTATAVVWKINYRGQEDTQGDKIGGFCSCQGSLRL